MNTEGMSLIKMFFDIWNNLKKLYKRALAEILTAHRKYKIKC